MFRMIVLILTSLLGMTSACSQPHGRFCTDIMGNSLTVSVSRNVANISANIFGSPLSCNNETFTFKNKHIYLSTDPNDCLNQHLSSLSACPCPPHITYDGNALQISDTPIGVIALKKC